MDWTGLGEGVLVLLLVAVLVPVVWLFARRRWLSRQGGMFDCAIRNRRGGWTLGVARYRDGVLQWFKVFSLSWRPRRVFRQGEWQVLGSRPLAAQEAQALYEHQHVVQLEPRDGGAPVHMAMDAPSVTGFSAWLEAAGPGRARYGHTAD